MPPKGDSYPRLPYKRLFQARTYTSTHFLLQTILLAAAVERLFVIPASLVSAGFAFLGPFAILYIRLDLGRPGLPLLAVHFCL